MAQGVIADIGVDDAGFWASGYAALSESVLLFRIDQFSGANNQAGLAAVGLPPLAVAGFVASGQKALEKNRMRIADVLRPDDFCNI